MEAVELLLPDGAFCPAQATRVLVRMSGPGLDKPLNVTGNTDIRALDNKSIPGTAVIPLLWTFRDAGAFVMPKPIVLDGDYRVTVSCLAGLSLASLGDTVADFTIDGEAGTFVVTSPNPKSDEVPDAPVNERPAGLDSATEPATAETPSMSNEESVQAGDADVPSASGDAAGLPASEQRDSAAGSPDSNQMPVQADSGSAVTSGAETAEVAESSSTKPLLIGAGIFLLVLVALLTIRSRRNTSS